MAMTTTTKRWKRLGTAIVSADDARYNPVEAACRLEGSIYHWEVRVGNAGSAKNQVADWSDLDRAVRDAVQDLVEGEANVAYSPAGPATPAAFFLGLEWQTAWTPVDLA